MTVSLRVVLVALLAATPLRAQDDRASPATAPATDPAPAPATAPARAGASGPTAVVGVTAGVGSGPIDAASWAVHVEMPVLGPLAATAELSGWGNGFGGQACIATVPESHRCSVSGWAALAGLVAAVPVGAGVEAFGQVAGGRFSRSWLGDERVVSGALSLEAGARLRLHERWHARVGGRSLRVHDDAYRSLLGEDLRYSMVTVGVGYRLGR